MATKAQVNEFIKTVGSAALKEAQERRASGKGWILPGICVSQGACECAWGTSKAMVSANGLFGFKVGSGTKFGDAWKGASYNTKTKEFYGEYVTIRDNFRAYDSIQDAITDYMDLLCGASRYKNAVNNTDALSTITAIKNGGYATSPTYINTIMSIYNNYPEIAALDAEFLGKAVASNTSSFKVGRNYTLLENMNVRDAAGGEKKKYIQLTTSGKSHALKQADGSAVLKKGTVVTCKEVAVVDGATWIKIPSGWVCAVSATGKIYIK